MRILIFSNAAFLFCILGCISTQAAVIERDWLSPGDGLLTFDDVNQREWLDLTQTQLFNFPGDTLLEQYQAVVAETQPGGDFAGFSVALEADVFALAESAGIDTSTLDFVTNQETADSLITLLGDPLLGASISNRWAAGFLNDGNVTESLTIAYVPAARVTRSAGVTNSNFFASGNGVWLHRPVPEPSSAIMSCIGCAGCLCWLVALRRSKR